MDGFAVALGIEGFQQPPVRQRLQCRRDMGFCELAQPDNIGGGIVIRVIGKKHQHVKFHLRQLKFAADRFDTR